MPENEDVKETASAEYTDAETMQVCQVPEPVVAGTRQLEIIDHKLIPKDAETPDKGKGVAVTLKNVTEAYIGKAIIKAVFYDDKGSVLDTVEIFIKDFEKDKTRVLRIESAKAAEADIKSYVVNVVNVIVTPVPAATGNDRIAIMKHSFGQIDPEKGATNSASIDLAIRNISDKTVATAIFDGIFYDSEGNILDVVRHKEYELRPSTSRAISIISDKVLFETARSYNVVLLKTITTDFERVQLRRHEVKTSDRGEEVRGILKNISDVKTDAALIATFQDSMDEKIGTRVILVKDIEPGACKQFSFVFTPPQGEKIKTYNLGVSEMIEESGTDSSRTS
jgi:hypothetical protein